MKLDDAMARLTGLDTGAVFTEADAQALDEVFGVIIELRRHMVLARAQMATVLRLDELDAILRGPQ